MDLQDNLLRVRLIHCIREEGEIDFSSIRQATKLPTYRGETGQALFEFVLSMILFMGGILFFVKLSLFIGISNYIQYAVFMSSRAYLSSALNPTEQIQNATKVLTKTIKSSSGRDRFAGLIKGVGGGNMTGVMIGQGEIYNENNVALSWQQGVRYTFKGSLGLGTLQGENSGVPNNATDIQLSAESWLDRSPTESECRNDMQGAYFDNGC